jgi:hypothetical protein
LPATPTPWYRSQADALKKSKKLKKSMKMSGKKGKLKAKGK